MEITYEDFEKVNLRSGTIVKAEIFNEVIKPAYKIWVDFGFNIGVLQTSAEVTINYTIDALIGKSIVGCVNLEEKNVGGFISQFLLVGFKDKTGAISLVSLDGKVANGQKLY